MDRRVKYQLNNKAKGLCVLCPNPVFQTQTKSYVHCGVHIAKIRKQQRKKFNRRHMYNVPEV